MREWDPAAATTEEIASVLSAINVILAADMPDDPPWCADSLREYLAVTMPGERRVCWLAESGGELLGYASVLMLDDIGVLELLVRPDGRRHGVGSALLAVAAGRTADSGFESIGVEVIGDTPAEQFYEEHGFRCAFVEVRNVLQLSTVDWLGLTNQARDVGAGYLIEYHAGGPPEELFNAYAAAKLTLREAPPNDLELRPGSYDAERLRASLTTLRARGMRPHTVLAVQESTGIVAGLTEVVVPAQRPSRADQYDTVVVPKHRGYGLGRAMKARMLLDLQANEPQVRDVQTWNAMENEPMLKVNAELGFRPDRQWREYEADVADLIRRLRT